VFPLAETDRPLAATLSARLVACLIIVTLLAIGAFSEVSGEPTGKDGRLAEEL
jgi:hypothetical protein